MPGKEATFTPYLRYKTVAYIEDGAPVDAEPFEITMRSNLTMEEVEEIVIKPDSKLTNAELWDLMAPHIVKWPFADPKTGEPIPPPAEAGGQVFKKAPPGLANLIYSDLLKVNLGHADPKS